jgi:hypothetical protein
MLSISSFSSTLLQKRFLMTVEFSSGEASTKLSRESKSKAFLYQGAKP